MLPTFIVIGAQKAGTWSLYHYLRGHPQVRMSPIKEPNFFVEEMAWAKGRTWYESLFDGSGPALAAGEMSTSYTMFPALGGVPGRIAALLPDVRLIYVLRDPIERLRSAYVQSLSAGTETRPIADALLLDARYVDHSRYALQLDQYLKWFDPSNLLIIMAEDLLHDRAPTLRRVLSFIGVDSSWQPDDLDVEHHQSHAKRVPRAGWRIAGDVIVRSGVTSRRLEALRSWGESSDLVTREMAPEETTLTEDLRARLADLLRPDVVRLRSLLGADFKGWGLL